MKTNNALIQIHFFLAALLLPASGIGQTNSSPPVRLAIISEDPALASASDLLTAELSKDSRLALLDREQIAKLFQEQALAIAAGGNRDYLKVGQLLGADGLLILTVADKLDRQVASCRLVAVKPGVELGLADYDFPLSDPGQWSKLLAAQFAPLLSKLTVLPKDAAPISILNLRSAAASSEGEVLERQLTLLLHDRLMMERNLFVLERRSMETLTDEKETLPLSESPFWNGSYLLEGTIDPRGFNTNLVTVDVQITPPDKKNLITLEVSGARTNLTQLIDDLALRVAGFVNKGPVNANWSAQDEAARYFEEATWMLRWGMFQEARTASEAAWALGKQTRQAAELRVKSYQACGGDPGTCTVSDAMVTFTRPPREGILGVKGFRDFATIPDSGRLSATIRAGDLWLEGPHLLRPPENNGGSAWYDLGVSNLVQCSWWLRYFYFNAEARTGAEEDLRRARQLCREMSSILAQQAQGDRAEALRTAIARHSEFWTETPEETLRVYREFLDKGQWPALRTRFFNDAYQEVSLSRQLHGYTRVTAHEPSQKADACSPCLAGWDWETRRRCPALWNGFIDELCASPKPPIQLEGLFLRCSYSWSGADYKRNLSRLLDFVREQFDTIAAVHSDENLTKDLETLVNMRVDSLPDPDKEQLKNELWGNFKRELETSIDKHRQAREMQKNQAARQSLLEGQEHYLQTQTNFNFMSFAKTLLHEDYNTQEAQRLLPLLTNYHARLKSIVPKPGASQLEVMEARQEQQQADTWIATLEKKLTDAIAGPATAPAARPASSRPPAHPSGLAQGPPPSLPGSSPGALHRGAIIYPGRAQNTPPILEKPLSTIQSMRFWQIPTRENDRRQGYPPGHIASWCYRDGTFWVQEVYGPFQEARWANFHGVDLKTFSARTVGFEGEQYAFSAEMVMGGKHEFDVDSNYLYLWLKDSVRRYSFQRRNWEVFAPAGDSKPQRLGNRLFFISPTSIRELLPDDALQLLASCRRRPALSALDNMDDYGTCHLFLDAKGRINICASNELYMLAAANDWQHYATVPARDLSFANLFDEGFIEQAASAPRWPPQTPTRSVCADGDCLWFLFDTQRPMMGAPGFSPAGPDTAGGLSLVRCKYDESRSMTISLTLPEPEAGAEQGSAGGQENLRRRVWIITATPEGLIATHSAAHGFWLIPRGVLSQAVSEAYARQSAIKAGPEGPASQPATP